MTRTPDSNTEKLNELFAESERLERWRDFLRNKIQLLKDSDTLAEHALKAGAQLYVASVCYEAVQDELKKLVDKDL